MTIYLLRLLTKVAQSPPRSIHPIVKVFLGFLSILFHYFCKHSFTDTDFNNLIYFYAIPIFYPDSLSQNAFDRYTKPWIGVELQRDPRQLSESQRVADIGSCPKITEWRWAQEGSFQQLDPTSLGFLDFSGPFRGKEGREGGSEGELRFSSIFKSFHSVVSN